MRATTSLKLILAVAGFAAAAPSQAQIANASTAATGLGGAFTARAQGYNAVAWNPANLAMPGNPGFSLTLGALDGQTGLRPIDFARLGEYGSDSVPKAVREEWLLDVEREGRQRGVAGGSVTALGLSIGSLALQVSTKGITDTDLNPGATELMLFGNKGRTGTAPANLLLDGSNFQGTAYTTAAMSYGMRLPIVPLPDFAIGVTAKYTVGHFVGIGMDAGSDVGGGDPATIAFPYVRNNAASTEDEDFELGNGVGIDLGAAWRIPGFRFGVSVQNVVNTFKWDTTKIGFRSATGIFSSSAESEFEVGEDSTETPFSTAPAALRERVIGMKFKPVIAAGVSIDWLPAITVSADIRQQVAGGIEVGPESMLSAGAEVRWLPFLPLRGGVQMMTGGFGVAGGFGLRLFGFEAGLAGYVRKRDGSQESGATVNFISIRP